MQIENYIKITDCKHRGLYIIDSRNLSIGVFDKYTNSFIGLRTKFSDIFLFSEIHYDASTSYGTVYPLKYIGQLPEDIEAVTSLIDKQYNTYLWIKENNRLIPVLRRDLRPNDLPHGKRILFEDVYASTLERIKPDIYPFTQYNEPLHKYLDSIQNEINT